MNLIDAYNDAKARALVGAEQLAVLESKLAGLETEIQGLEQAIARHRAKATDGLDDVQRPTVEPAEIESLAAGSGTVDSPDHEIADMTRSDAIAWAVEALPNPVSTSQVLALLQISGRPGEDAGSVGNGLTYLQRQGRVEKVGRALWQLCPPNEAAQLESDDGDTSVLDFVNEVVEAAHYGEL